MDFDGPGRAVEKAGGARVSAWCPGQVHIHPQLWAIWFIADLEQEKPSSFVHTAEEPALVLRGISDPEVMESIAYREGMSLVLDI
jgi:hypothetical protein